ncbi:hypothetical protein ACF07S_10525 [Streptomyces sp. NPDC016640]|uniref:hypothetical protein n=1 Tax=Streptomyces sp. NPDC016640 TaxID=3364969 RepID=UPI0036F6AF1D
MPTTDDYGQGVSIASLSDAPNAESLAKNIANAIVARSVLRFASASARSAAIDSPAAGMVAYLQDTKQLTFYDGSSWIVFWGFTDETTAGAVAASGWSVASFRARKTAGVCSLSIELSRTGDRIGSSSAGNVEDVLMCALPQGWRPDMNTSAICGNGFGFGEARIETDGQIYLRAWTSDGEISTGDIVRVSACYVQ